MKKLICFRMVIIGIFFWCVIFPFFWAYSMSQNLEIKYTEVIASYTPEFIFAIFSALILPCIWAHKKWALYVLWVGVIAMPFVQFTTSQLTYVPWLFALFLLAFLSWLFFMLNKMRC
jgi:peptidoglycan/LPS O-acetylase OafA/YrhL